MREKWPERIAELKENARKFYFNVQSVFQSVGVPEVSTFHSSSKSYATVLQNFNMYFVA